MLTMHPTLLVGPADWDPARMPKESFLDRIAALFAACDPAIAGGIVYGDPRSHAELAYLTHMTPKLEPCVALIPREGTPRLLVGGGANMIGSARPLTWIETLAPLREAGATIARWRDELNGPVVLVNGSAMPLRMRQGIERALGAPPADASGFATMKMRRKDSRELPMVREACDDLAAAFSAMRAAQRDRKGMSEIVLAGEAAAWRRGAQDVRSLFGRDGWLAPFTLRDDAVADPLQVYLAVRLGGYWAEGFALLSSSPQPVARAARELLDRAVGLMTPGAPRCEIGAVLARGIPPDRAHRMTRADCGGPIGLDLPKGGCFGPDDDEPLAPDEVYSVRIGLDDGAAAAVVSAMVRIAENGPEVLWRGADA